MRAVVLVEGPSDRAALQALAHRRGRDLEAEGAAVVVIGGAQAIRRALAVYGPQGVAVAGLADAGEARDFRRALGVETDEELERLGFFVCRPDLEGELIATLGVERVEAVVEAGGDLRALRTLQKQPEWRGRPAEEQLRRFFGSGGSRKIRYAPLLIDALDLERVPRPLDAVLEHVRPARPRRDQ